MEFLFIDDSGDNGFSEGSTEFLILAGISVESSYWKEYFWKIKELRQKISQKYGLKFEELKGSDIFTHRGPFFNSLVASPKDSLWIYKQCVELICDDSVNLFVTRQSKKEFEKRQKQTTIKNIKKLFDQWIWTEYLQMYDNYLLYKSKQHGKPQTGLIYSDNSGQQKYIRKIVKSFSTRFDNQSELPGAGIVEDVIFRDSKSSYFIQLSDILAFSINKIAIGKRKNDEFEIEPEIKKKLIEKINEPQNLTYIK
jgi:hypothetical protein